MKIEIVDRKKYVDLAEAGIAGINAYHSRVDREFEAKWRKRTLLPNRLYSEFPENNWVTYPCTHGLDTKHLCERLKFACLSEGTETITVDVLDLQKITNAGTLK